MLLLLLAAGRGCADLEEAADVGGDDEATGFLMMANRCAGVCDGWETQEIKVANGMAGVMDGGRRVKWYTALRHTMQRRAVQYSTVQYSAAQYSTAEL